MESAKKKASASVDAASHDAKRKPVKSFQLGDCSASVWPRDVLVDGEAVRFYSVTLERRYPGEGGYKYSRSFNPEDLATVIALCQQASAYIGSLSSPQPASVTAQVA